MQLIWCFGIAILSERPEVAGGVKNPSSNTATEWKSSSARKILGTPKQMRKCMELTSLTVINLLQEGSHVSERDTIEGVKIATRTMHLIDEDTKRDWSRASGLAKSAVSKVAEKILRPAISPDVQFACLCFYAAMAGDARLPEKILTRYDTLLLGLKERDSDPNTLRETLESSLTLYIPQMQESTLHQLLVKILEASGSSRPAELRNTGTLVKTLLNATTGPLPRLLASALCSTELQEPLQMFLRTDFESSLGRGDTCDTSTNHLKRNLYTNTISMLLASLLAAGAAQYDSAARIGLALLTKQRTLPPLNLQCSHPKPSRRPSISLFEQGCTPATGIQRQDWRDTLSSELERHSRYQTDSVIRLYAQISQNLEDRCNTAEEPLRQEQAKVKELTSVNAQLKRQVEDLETKVSDQETYLNVLEDEKYDLTAKMESLEADAKEAHQENNGLLVKLEELRGDFDRVNKEADESLRKAQEDLRAKEREFLSTMSAQEESLHSLDRHVGELSAQNEDFRNQVDALRAEKNSLDESYNTLQAEINALSRNLEDERDIRMRQAEETERLSAVQSNLEIQLATTKEKLEQSHNEFEDSEKKIAQLDATRSNLEGQLTRADQQLEAALSERLRERSELQAYIKEAEKALCDVEAKYANELDALKLKVRDAREQESVRAMMGLLCSERSNLERLLSNSTWPV